MNHSAMLVAPLQECKLTMSSCCFASPVRVAAALSEHALAVPQYPSGSMSVLPLKLRQMRMLQPGKDAHITSARCAET